MSKTWRVRVLDDEQGRSLAAEFIYKSLNIFRLDWYQLGRPNATMLIPEWDEHVEQRSWANSDPASDAHVRQRRHSRTVATR